MSELPYRNRNNIKTGFYREHQQDYLLLFIALIFRFLTSFITLFSLGIIVIKDFFSKKIKFKIDFGFVLLGVSVALYARNASLMGLATFHNCLWIFFLSVLAFLTGKGFAWKLNDYPSCYYFIYFIFLLLALPQIPVTLIDIAVNGLINPDRGLAILGAKDTQQATTGRTVQLAMAISGIFMLFYHFKDKSLHKIRNYFVILAIVAEICTLHYVSRTGVAVLAISFSLGIILKLGISRKAFFVIILASIVLYFLSDSALGNVFAARETDRSSIGNAGGRSGIWEMGMLMLLSSPNGYELEGYVHNYWLDFGREGGLYACISLILFSLYALWNGFISTRRTNIPSYLSTAILIYSIMFPLVFFTEPIHSGSPLAMYGYYMFTGLVIEMNRRTKPLK